MVAIKSAKNSFNESSSNNNNSAASDKKLPALKAASSIKKLLKSFKRSVLFTSSPKAVKRITAQDISAPLYHSCASAEEHQNWLNERLEVEQLMMY